MTSVSDSTDSMVPGSGSRKAKMTQKEKKKVGKSLWFASARGFLWVAVGISCSLLPFHCGLRIKILQIKKISFFICKFFGRQTPGSG